MWSKDFINYHLVDLHATVSNYLSIKLHLKLKFRTRRHGFFFNISQETVNLFLLVFSGVKLSFKTLLKWKKNLPFCRWPLATALQWLIVYKYLSKSDCSICIISIQSIRILLITDRVWSHPFFPWKRLSTNPCIPQQCCSHSSTCDHFRKISS